MRWADRIFNTDISAEQVPEFVSRLRETPVRLASTLEPLSCDLLIRRQGESWSIQEHAGHLIDVEGLFLGRLDDFETGAPALRPAEMSGRKTYEARYNERALAEILEEFRRVRFDYVGRLEAWAPADFGRVAHHPRLNMPMSAAAMLHFQAEHDGYHLARIDELIAGDRAGDMHLSLPQLEAGVQSVRNSPKDRGALELIVRRPDFGEREELAEATLDLREGLIGDNWSTRPSRHTADGSPHPDMQLNIMNSRVAQLVAGARERWKLAGDQLYVDLDLTKNNLPAGTRLLVGSAEIEITAQPHTGCKKFAERFGVAALKFVNSELGREFKLRGINARVVRAGTIREGDVLQKA